MLTSFVSIAHLGTLAFSKSISLDGIAEVDILERKHDRHLPYRGGGRRISFLPDPSADREHDPPPSVTQYGISSFISTFSSVTCSSSAARFSPDLKDSLSWRPMSKARW